MIGHRHRLNGILRRLLGGSILAGLAVATASAQPVDALRAGFAAPGPEARPYVWWHWMNGNVTQEGIAKDLDWFSRIGVGGFSAFDGAGAVPRFVDKPLIYMHDDWKAAFRFAMAEADRRGLEASIAASPGWSQTGGPWVKPQDAMKKYVWTETWVDGGRRVNAKLPQPSDTAGYFQDVAVATRSKPPGFYRDARVFAYRVAGDARSQTVLAPQITTSAAFEADGSPLPGSGGVVRLDPARLSNGKVADPIFLAPSTPEAPARVDIAYAAPVTMRGVTVANGDIFAPGWRLEWGQVVRVEASDDGRDFRTVSEGLYTGAQRTFAFPATTARTFRISITAPTLPMQPRPAPTPRSPTTPGQLKSAQAAPAPAPTSTRPLGFPLSELVMRPVAPVEQFEVKAGFGVVNDYYAIPTREAGGAVRATDVVDLSGKMAADGTLDWRAPAGRWVVVRLGYGLTGKENGPASEEATGLEVDKLNAEHVRGYVNTYLDMYASATGPDLIGKHGLRAILNDSYEARFANWTDDMLGEFQRRRGYDPSPWLPVLTGVVIESADKSDRFLWDWRRTIFDLMAQSHYKVVAEEARKRGMIAYAEALEDNRSYQGDDMEMRQYADVPMASTGAFMTQVDGGQPPTRRHVDNHGAASVAHVFGRPIVASETFTSAPNTNSPRELKALADLVFLHGVNRLFIHTSAHQPGDMGPGSTLNNIGFFFTRNEPWAGMAKAWVEFLTRTSFMMQQGQYVADYAYFYGEEAPIVGVWGSAPAPELPTGRGFDFVNGDIVLNHLTAKDGQAVAPSGARYPLIYIGGRSSRMTLPVLNKLKALVEQGVSIAGEKPKRSPSLADDDAAFQRSADALWGSGEPGMRTVGKGRVYNGLTADDALSRMGVGKDMAYIVEPFDAPFDMIHRRVGDTDMYYVANLRAQQSTNDMSFRVLGKEVEFWNPVTGEVTPATYRTENGRTVVPITLGAADSVFVIMRGSGPPSRTAPRVQTEVAQVLDGPWKVAFQANRGAPAELTLPGLMSLSDHPTPGVRYFSGEAAYTKTIDLPAGPEQGKRYFLDLGDVQDMARITINGQEIGVAWRPPFRMDVTRALKRGANEVKVEVANTWKNRLIGDQQPGMVQVTFGPSAAEYPDTPLLRSGLIGPVRLMETR